MDAGDFWMTADISIHAPHEGCDCFPLYSRLEMVDISIHAPHEGCDKRCFFRDGAVVDFNPRTP